MKIKDDKQLTLKKYANKTPSLSDDLSLLSSANMFKDNPGAKRKNKMNVKDKFSFIVAEPQL